MRRIAGELRPEVLDDLGLQSALRSLCTTAAAHRGLSVERQLDLGGLELSPEVELAVYRVAQESVTNVMRHSHASRVTVTLLGVDGSVRLIVRDDGRGLPAAAVAGVGIARHARACPARRRTAHGRHGGRGRHRGAAGRSAARRAAMTVPLKTRILLADDHPMVRRGLRMVLDAEPDLNVVAEAGDGAEAVELALAKEIDLAVLDIAMPRLTGLQAAAELKPAPPEVRSLMLSMYDSEQYFFEALKAGASGYVLKSVADRDLVEACRAAMRGEPFLYPAAVTALIRDYLDRASRGEGRRPTRSPRASWRSSSSWPRGIRATRSPTLSSSARRRSSTIAATSSRSSGCATEWS